MFSYEALFVLICVAVSGGTPYPRQSCADVSVIFARGTFEEAPIGIVFGPPFESALQNALGGMSLGFVGVDYPASIAGFKEGGDPNGATTMANDVTSTANSCPDTQIIMSGYSQGAQVTHLAAVKLSSSVQNRVVAVAVFGDPDDGQGFPGVLNGRSITFCAKGDDICAGGQVINAAHLSYGQNASAAASFVESHV